MSWIIAVTLLLVPTSVYAQDGNESTPRELSMTSGPLLPNQIEGMTEIMPIFGFRYKPADWALEFGYLNANSDDVNYNSLTMSYRGSIAQDGFLTLLYTGFDYHYYLPPGATEYLSGTGFHLGGGMMAFMGDRVWFRSEMKMNFNPGTALYIGFGFNFMLSSPGR